MIIIMIIIIIVVVIIISISIILNSNNNNNNNKTCPHSQYIHHLHWSCHFQGCLLPWLQPLILCVFRENRVDDMKPFWFIFCCFSTAILCLISIFFHCSFEHLYFAHSLTIDVSIAFLFPFLELDKMFSVCKWASTSFLIASKIWTFAYFLRVRVSKVDANSAWPSTRTDASTLSSPLLHFLLQDSFLAAMLCV